MSGSEREIQLSVRIRPCKEPSSAVDVALDGKLVVSPSGDSFSYPSHVVKGSDQAVAFDALASVLIDRARAGFNCTLMAYGQTGSGKTYTMFGPAGCLTEASVQQARNSIPESWGLFPRAVLTLMQSGDVTATGTSGGSRTTLHASAVEVYHENVFDLLDDRAQLSIGYNTKQMGNKVAGKADIGGSFGGARAINGVHPASCTCHGCFKAQEEAKKAKEAARLARVEAARAEAAAAKAAKSQKRTTLVTAGANTLPTGASSSSTSSLRQGSRTPSGETTDHIDSFATVGEKLTPLRNAEDVARFARTVEATRTAKSHLLNDRSSRSHCLVKVHFRRQHGTDGKNSRSITLLFVDLAGSERLQRTGAEGDAMAEALSINSSLSALGRVIKSLGARGGKQHVPYRDAALTMLLRDSFGGKSCTSVVINVAAESEHAEESICSLKFGERMSVVRNSPTVVVDSDAGDEAQLARVLDVTKKELAQMVADGLGGGFVDGAPNSEKLSLAENMRKLAEAEREVRDCITQITEARSSGATTAPLEQKLRSSSALAEVLQGIVERQQTIKTLWALPTPAFKRKAAEVRELEGRVMLALGVE